MHMRSQYSDMPNNVPPLPVWTRHIIHVSPQPVALASDYYGKQLTKPPKTRTPPAPNRTSLNQSDSRICLYNHQQIKGPEY